MGIKGLSQFLKAKSKAYAGVPFIRPQESQKLAIDVSLFLHKFFYSVGPEGLGYAFGTLRNNILKHNCEPLWVFDGQKLSLKDNERAKRAKARENRAVTNYINTGPDGPDGPDNIVVTEIQYNAHPGKADYTFIRDFLSGDKIYTAKYEAEALCCYMVHTNQAYAALTSDTDVFAYLCPRVIHGASMTLQDARLIEIESILQDLGLTKKQFQQMCVYCGNDFIENVASIGPASACKAVLANKEIGTAEYQEQAKIILHLFETYCYENE